MKTNPSLSGGSEFWRRAIPVLVVLFTVIAFAPVLQNTFVNWDDTGTLTDNLLYRGLGADELKWMFTTYHMGHYQPLSWVSFGADYLIWGMNPAGYHLTNLILHAANAAVVYRIAYLLLCLAGSPGRTETSLRLGAAFAALVFALHPLRVESVAWATERRDVLSSFFLLLTVLFYLRAHTAPEPGRTRLRWTAVTFIVYVLSLLSKAGGITLPLILLVLDVYPLCRRGARILEKIPFFLAAAVFGVAALRAQRDAGALLPMDVYGLEPRVAQALFGAVFYLWKTALPLELSPIYEIVESDVHLVSWTYLFCASAVLGISYIFWRIRQRMPACLAVWICYLLLLAPVLGIAQSGSQRVADRYSYMACIGWAILAGSQITTRLAGAAFLIPVILGGMTWQYATVWHDSETLWRHTLAIRPQSFFGHYNLAQALTEKKEFGEAIEEYRETLKIWPTHAKSHLNLGMLLARQEKHEEAARSFWEALQIDPGYADAHHQRAKSLGNLGKSDEAVEHYFQAIQLYRQDQDERAAPALAHNDLGNELLFRNEFDAAVEHYREALRFDPRLEVAHHNLGFVLVRKGRIEEGISHYRQAVQINPSYAKAHYNLGAALRKLGRLEEAAASYRNALEAAPPDWPMRNTVQSELDGILRR